MAEGRRDRLRARARREGLDSLEYHEVLELILYPLIPRKDTNPIAHDLINYFGSLDKVFQADPKDTFKIKNMTKIASEWLAYFYKVNLIAKRSGLDKEIDLSNYHQSRQYISTYFMDKKKEELYVFSLNHKFKLIAPNLVCTGGLNDVHYSKKKIIEIALKDSARYMIVAHNHISGSLVPSDDDILSTYELLNALKCVECELIDHLVLNQKDIYSFNERGLMDAIIKAKDKYDLMK